MLGFNISTGFQLYMLCALHETYQYSQICRYNCLKDVAIIKYIIVSVTRNKIQIKLRWVFRLVYH